MGKGIIIPWQPIQQQLSLIWPLTSVGSNPVIPTSKIALRVSLRAIILTKMQIVPQIVTNICSIKF